MSVYLSGMQPSGVMHIGNYIGAMKQWNELSNHSKETSEKNQFLFMIADLHAFTSRDMSQKFKNCSIDNYSEKLRLMLACYVAILGEEKITNNEICIFQQSKIPEHSQLMWLLSCCTPISWLNRMTQYKDKSQKFDKENINLGLLSYPVLQAVDILLYDANFVPVGEDQRQHIELTRDIAIRLNNYFDLDFFTIPDAMIDNHLKRIMSLVEPVRKMSKSDASGLSCIYLTDSDDEIFKKIKKAQTDSVSGIYYDFERAGVVNLINIYSAFSGNSVEEVVKNCSSMQTGQFKELVANCLIEKISPIREKINYYLKDDNLIEKFSNNSFAQEVARKKFNSFAELFYQL
jgi:tryptophanyl-tRNA synthetase